MSKNPRPNPIENLIALIGSVPSLVLHTVVFASSFVLSFAGFFPWDRMLLILTTILSLEAIYLAIFIQMSVNLQTTSLREVEEGIDEIQEDVQDMSADVEDIQEGIEVLGDEGATEPGRGSTELSRANVEGVGAIAEPHPVTLETLTAHVQTLLAELEALKQKR